ncbi:MAG TPA: hypothetical protein VGB63_07575 [Pedobacter sp.]|jgi:hypothetical protein
MKFLTVTLLLLVLSFNVFAQSPLSKLVINDYSTAAYGEYKYGNGTMVALIQTNLRKSGYSMMDIEIGMERLGTDRKFLELTFEALYNHIRIEQMLFANLMGIGMRAGNAKTLAEYIHAKYSAKERAQEVKEREEKALNNRAVIEQAKRSYNQLLASYINGQKVLTEDKLVIEDSEVPHLDLTGLSQNIEVMKPASEATFDKKNILSFLSRFFNEELIYFTISKEGLLESISNSDNSVKLTNADHPELQTIIRRAGAYKLKHNGKLYSVAYRYPALKIGIDKCTENTQYFFRIGSNKLESVSDSIAIKALILNSTTKENYCGLNLNFSFDKEELKRKVLTYFSVEDMKHLRKVTNTNSNMGAAILGTAFTLATRIPTSTGPDKKHENLFRFIDRTSKRQLQLRDFSNGSLVAKSETISGSSHDFIIEAYESSRGFVSLK